MVPRTPLKVLHICQRDDPATGGAVRVAVEYVKRLPQQSIDAHCLFVYGPPGPFQKELGDRAHYLGLHSSRDIFNFARLPQFIQQLRPHIIHHHDGLLWIQLLTFYHPNIAKVVHGHITVRPQSPFSKGSLASRLQRHSTDLLIAITEDTRKSYLQYQHYSPEQVVVVYNGVDLAKFYPPTETGRLAARKSLGLPVNATVVGFVGRLHCAMKGPDDFLQMIAHLTPDYWGLIVGTGPDMAMLLALAEKLGIANRVVFTGLLENPALAYQAMTLFCLTSHYEPFGLVVAEAMASRIPVVGFACKGGVCELLTSKTGWVVPNRSLNQMAEIVMSLTQKPEVMPIKTDAALQQITQRHSWDSSTATLANNYFKLLNA